MRTSTKIKRILETNRTIGVSYSHKEYALSVIKIKGDMGREQFYGKSFAAVIQLAYASIFSKKVTPNE